jgi:hypothetical protein
MNMILKIKKIEESGYRTAMLALSKNKKQSVENMPALALKLRNKAGSHSKFLRFMQVSFEIECPLHWDLEFQTYKIGTNCSSSSAMHTLIKELTHGNSIDDMFEKPIKDSKIRELRNYAFDNDIVSLKQDIPGSFMYSLVWQSNYAVLRNIISDRTGHRLPHWKVFIDEILKQVDHPEYLTCT